MNETLMRRKLNAYIETSVINVEERKETIMKHLRERIGDGDFDGAYMYYRQCITCNDSIKQLNEFKSFLLNEQNGD